MFHYLLVRDDDIQGNRIDLRQHAGRPPVVGICLGHDGVRLDQLGGILQALLNRRGRLQSHDKHHTAAHPAANNERHDPPD